MERKEFLKRLGMSTVILPLLACSEDEVTPDPDSGACATTPSETAGPFPTKNPTSMVMMDITSDRTGVDFSIKITVQNRNSNCEPMAGAMVDIWHCDKDGYYSEYGGTGLQPRWFARYITASPAAAMPSYLLPVYDNSMSQHIAVANISCNDGQLFR